MFTLVISCLTTSKLPWFHGPNILGMQYCSLKHWIFLSPPETSTTEHCLHFGSASSFFLELFLYSSPVAYLTPTNLWVSSFSVISFYLFILFWGSQGKNAEMVCQSFSELFTMTHQSWVALQGMASGFIDLDKVVVLVISLVSFLW